MGTLIRAMDWAQTPLGPIAQWPQSLRTTVSLCLASNFPICLIWGPQRTMIYNDGYWPRRRPQRKETAARDCTPSPRRWRTPQVPSRCASY